MPLAVPLRLYGRPSDRPALDWASVEAQLESAGTYWVVPCSEGQPHPRPVWGVWLEEHLYLSIGTPITLRMLADDPRLTVHLDSGTEVVIIEGQVQAPVRGGKVVAAYNQKYDWHYDAEQYGPLQCVEPATVLAWRAGGWAGRESFKATGRWQF